MIQILDFLSQLAANNDREWFNAHKPVYQECMCRFNSHVTDVIEGIRQFDDSIGPLSVADCTYRIYRDTRFSNDKTPYKTHFGAFIAPGGKKSGYSGYYFQVGAFETGFPGGCMLATGNYHLEPKVLKLLREDIDLDSEGTFASAISNAWPFTLDRAEQLKRVPNGYPADHPRADLLRLRNFCLCLDAGRGYFMHADWKKRLIDDFERTAPFLHLINRCIGYSQEQS